MIKQILLFSVVAAIAYFQCTSVTNCKSCPDTGGGGQTPASINIIVGAAGPCTDCNSNFYLNSGACTACAFKRCWECEADGDCLECNYDLGYLQFPVEGFCQCDTTKNFVADGINCRCANGFYKKSNACAPCSDYDTQCLTCSATDCLSCAADFVVAQSGTSCEKKCSIPGCLTCFNTTVCSTCGPNSNPSNSLTACNCNAGFWRNGGLCSACIANCATCTTGTTCTACS